MNHKETLETIENLINQYETFKKDAAQDEIALINDTLDALYSATYPIKYLIEGKTKGGSTRLTHIE